MKILTTVKKVVDVELTLHVEDGAIVEDGLQYVMNAWDENAVEATVQLKENHNAETTLVSIGGGEENTKIIRKGFAMGIENGIQIDDPALDKADASIYAKILQKVYEKGDYDLVILGKQAQDTDSGQTGIIFAEYLSLPCVSNVITIEVMDDQHIGMIKWFLSPPRVGNNELDEALTQITKVMGSNQKLFVRFVRNRTSRLSVDSPKARVY